MPEPQGRIYRGARRCARFAAAVACCWLAGACSVTKHVPQGSYLLTRNDIRIERNRELSKQERVTKADLEEFVRQHPTQRLLGTNFYLWAYNSSNPKRKNTWWNRFKRKIGKATASAIAAAVRTGSPCRDYRVDVEGGTLRVAFEPDGKGGFTRIELTGPARKVFEGEFADDFRRDGEPEFPKKS